MPFKPMDSILTDKQTNKKALAKSSESPASQDGKTPTATGEKKSFPVFLVLTFLLVLVSAGYFQYRLEIVLAENQILKQQQQVQQSQLASQIEQNAGQQALMEKSDEAAEKLEQKLLGLNSIVQQLPGARAEDWKLAEVEYLLRLANQRVQLQNEVAGAEALLKAADEILAELSDPALLQVRDFIAQERLALGEAQTFDRQGVYLTIQALKKRIHSSVIPPQHFHAEQTTQSALADSGNEAPAMIESSNIASTLWQQLTDLVQVRHRDDAFDAPLLDSQYQLLEHSLLLMMEQAQWALLKQDQVLFEQSLKNAISWIDGKLRHSAAADMQSSLEALAQTNIVQELPDISKSLKQLRGVIKARTYRPVVPEPAKEKADSKIKADSKTDAASASQKSVIETASQEHA